MARADHEELTLALELDASGRDLGDGEAARAVALADAHCGGAVDADEGEAATRIC